MKTENIKPARFRLQGYMITNASIKLSGDEIGESIEFGIDPEGQFDIAGNMFTLILSVMVKDQQNNFDLSLSINGVFEYDAEDINELKPFISMNAPAILFPYIRAYVSNITALSGMQPIILPTLNMEGVGKALLEKIN